MNALELRGLEKSFGGFVRSYPFGGDDVLAVASTGCVWDGVLLAGKSFRNYGEMANTKITTPNHVDTRNPAAIATPSKKV